MTTWATWERICFDSCERTVNAAHITAHHIISQLVIACRNRAVETLTEYGGALGGGGDRFAARAARVRPLPHEVFRIRANGRGGSAVA